LRLERDPATNPKIRSDGCPREDEGMESDEFATAFCPAKTGRCKTEKS